MARQMAGSKRGALTALAASLLVCLSQSALSETIILKCNFKTEIPAEVTYLLNTATPSQMTVFGGFGTHSAFATMNGPFVTVIEPNNGATVSTIIHIEDEEVPYAVRTTFGLVPRDYQRDLPGQKYLVVTQQGNCPVQR